MNDRTAAILSAAGKIEHMYDDWQKNGGVSPDDGDCVRICAQELGIPWPIKRMSVLEGGTQAEYERQTLIANDLYELQCGDPEEQLVNGLEIACWIIDRLAPKPKLELGGPHDRPGYCRECSGRGRRYQDGETCDGCKGTGRVE